MHPRADEVVEVFEERWRRGDAPAIRDIVADIAEGTLRRTALLELVAVDMEFRWRAVADGRSGQGESVSTTTPTLEDYVREWPDLGPSDELPLMLIVEEFRVRNRWGDRPDVREYTARYRTPGLEAALAAAQREIRAEGGHPDRRSTCVAEHAERSSTAEFSSTDPGRPPVLPRPWGDYDLVSLLGEGGMGSVYLANHRQTGRRVALKTIRPDLLPAPHSAERSLLLERFDREVRAAARLEHDNVVRVYETGHWENQPFYAMQYVPGRDLEAWMREVEFSESGLAAVLLPVCLALEAAHRQGIVHRDVKPRNILLDDDDRPYVGDFGLAKSLEGDASLTHTGAILGTPCYMSPEQARGARIDGRTDVYSLGATLYEALTGRPPFVAATPAETMHEVVHREPTPPRAHSPTVSRNLETVCLKCLEKDPADRYATAQELADELRRIRDGLPIRARRVSPFVRGLRWCRRKPIVSGLALSIVVLAVVLAIGASTYSRKSREHAIALRDIEAEVDVVRRRAGEAEVRADVADREAEESREESERQARVAETTRLANRVAAARSAWDEANMPGYFTSLDAISPGLEHDLVAGMSNRGNERLLLPESAKQVAVGPDGRHVATAGPDGVAVFDVRTRQRLRRIPVEGRPKSVGYDRTGDRLAIGTDEALIVWDLRAGKLVMTTPGRGNDHVAFSPDGRWIARNGPNSRGRLSVHDARTGEPRFSRDVEHRPEMVGLCWTGDGAGVVTVHRGNILDGFVRTWDAATGDPLSDMADRPPMRDPTVAAASPDGSMLAIGSGNGTIGLWSLVDRRFLGTLRYDEAHGNEKRDARITRLNFGPDGRRLLSIGADWTIRLWDVPTRTASLVLRGHRGAVTDVVSHPDGRRLVSVGEDRTLRIWSGRAQRPREFEAHEGGLVDLDVHPSGALLTSSSDSIKTWNMANFATRRTFSRLPEWLRVTSVRFDASAERIVSGEFGGKVSLWDVASGSRWSGGNSVLGIARRFAGGRVLREFDSSDGYVADLAVSQDGAWAILVHQNNDASVKTWNLETGDAGPTFSIERREPTDAELESERRELERLLDEGNAIGRVEPFSPRLNSADISPDGTLLAAGGDNGRITVWNFRTGERARVLKGHTGSVTRVRFHPDGQRLITAAWDGTVRLWDAPTGRELAVLDDHVARVDDFAVHPDGELLATVAERTVRLWHLDTALPTLTLNVSASGPTTRVRRLSFTPDGRRLLAGADDGRVVVWETSADDVVED